jgi:hypothetical protein
MAKPKMVKTDLDEPMAGLAGKTDHRTLVVWACDCAERVLPYFENQYRDDPRPRAAIAAGRRWVQTGIFKMAVIRQASLSAHAAARAATEGSAARSAARAAGQAVAAAHVPAHALAAAIYAATAVRNASPAAEAGQAARTEREWQHRHLMEVRTRAAH